MKKSMKKDAIINIGFYVGLGIKAVDALIEFIGGLLLVIINHDRLNHLIKFIANSELREDPKDIIINYFITLGQNFSISSQQTVAIYLLLHGISKIVVIWLLFKKKLWAFPLAVAVFGLFITYEIYNYYHSPSVLLFMFIIIDIAMIAIIILEYKRLKSKKEKEEL
jgi:uncharacterized membrane protein